MADVDRRTGPIKFEDTHPGAKGKTLAEKMRDKTDELYEEWMKYTGDDADIHQGRIEGACEMMAILTSTTSDLQWDSTEARYEDRERQKANAKNT